MTQVVDFIFLNVLILIFLMYDTTQSSKTSFTIDSITECSATNESSEIPLTEQTTASNLQSPKKKLKKCSKKRTHELEILEAKEKEFNDEKMHRMDRFLDLFERSIKNKERDKAYIKIAFSVLTRALICVFSSPESSSDFF